MSHTVETRIVGNYVIGPTIGRGATSEVFAAEHRFFGDAVALKLMRPQLADDERASEALVEEATRTRSIAHPNVVRVLDAGRHERGAYLVMERITGESFSTRLARGPLDEAEARRLFAAIADGMQAVHDAGIVHRDLKPGNVMLEGDTPKIVDFGIAKYLGGASAAETSRVIGTPAYMAPEQLAGSLIGPFVDVWAFGVMLFEAVTGRLPFVGFERGRWSQLFEQAPRARSLVEISPSLDDLIARCLAKDPARRPASMAELARVLRGGTLELDPDVRITADLTDDPALPTITGAQRPRARRWVGWAAAAAVAIGTGIAAASWVTRDEPATVASTPLPPADSTPTSASEIDDAPAIVMVRLAELAHDLSHDANEEAQRSRLDRTESRELKRTPVKRARGSRSKRPAKRDDKRDDTRDDTRDDKRPMARDDKRETLD